MKSAQEYLAHSHYLWNLEKVHGGAQRATAQASWSGTPQKAQEKEMLLKDYHPHHVEAGCPVCQ